MNPLPPRLVWLHLRSRRAPLALALVIAIAAVLRLMQPWAVGPGPFAGTLPLALATGAAAIIAASTQSPFADPEHATPAQRALAVYLLRQAHDNPSGVWPLDRAITAAAARFAALAPAARTAWLTTHLAALRAGSLTPQDIP